MFVGFSTSTQIPSKTSTNSLPMKTKPRATLKPRVHQRHNNGTQGLKSTLKNGPPTEQISDGRSIRHKSLMSHLRDLVTPPSSGRPLLHILSPQVPRRPPLKQQRCSGRRQPNGDMMPITKILQLTR